MGGRDRRYDAAPDYKLDDLLSAAQFIAESHSAVKVK
jgi:hypothetical protein